MKRGLLISVVIAVAAGAALPAKASACSCAFVKPGERLADGEPAFTGRVISRRKHEGAPDYPGNATYTYVFRVGHSYNRRHRKRLRLTAGSQSAACGVLFRKGARVGAFLHRNGGKLTTNLCSIVDPDDLIRAGRRLKEQKPAASSPTRPREARSGGSCPSAS